MANQLARRIGRRLARVVVLDASALIALVSSKESHHLWALDMFRDTAAFELQMSSLTQAEAMVHPAREGEVEKFETMIQSLGIEITPIELGDSSSLAKLRVKSSLKMPDVAVLNQALKVNGTVATTDKKLADAAKHLGCGVFHPFQETI